MPISWRYLHRLWQIKPDLSYIETAGRTLAQQLSGDELVILESTSPPGATDRLADVIWKNVQILPKRTLQFAHAPERVLPGQVMRELVTNDRIIGGSTPEAAERAVKLYRSFCKAELVTTNTRTANVQAGGKFIPGCQHSLRQ